MSVLVIPVILLQTKRKRNTKYHKTLNCQNERQNFRLLLHGDTHKKNHGLDYFTETNLPKASN